MSYKRTHLVVEPSRTDVDRREGLTLLEFGAPWCGHCQAAQAAIENLLRVWDIPHLKIEDGKGRPLGRSFSVKLWPTLIVMRDGEELARVVRPRERTDLMPLLDALTAASPEPR